MNCKCGCGRAIVKNSNNQLFATPECSRQWHNANRRKPAGHPQFIAGKSKTRRQQARETIGRCLAYIGGLQRAGEVEIHERQEQR